MIWVFLLIVSEIILLFLPIYIYDQYFWIIIILAYTIQIFIVGRIERVLLKKTKTTALFFLILVFSITNYLVYDYRKENAYLNSKIIITEGQVVRQYSQGGRKTTKRYYLEYEFNADNKRYKHVDEVQYWVWFNYNFNKNLKIEYVQDNPKISRIHKSSLIEYPGHEELMKRANEEYNKKK